MYAVTNHLYPKEEFFADLVDGFAKDNDSPITETYGAPRFELRRPESGNEWLSTSIWTSTESFDEWRSSMAIQRTHAGVRYDMYSQRAGLSFHDVLMNAEPGRPPVLGQPAPYKRLGVGKPQVIVKLLVAAGHEDEAAAALAATVLPSSGFLWWDVWKNVRSNEWWTVTYFESAAECDAMVASGALLPPSHAPWLEKAAELVRYSTELERIPGMAASDRA